MPEFLHLLPPKEAIKLLLENLKIQPAEDDIPTVEALDRVTARSVTARHPLPSFPRSSVDGFAVRASDTFGASESLPAYLRVIGEVPMGASPAISLAVGHCAVIHTGGMLPSGSDAVVMLEYTQSISAAEIEVMRPAAVGENVLKVGEDVAEGEQVIASGVRLRPAEIGGLMALGFTRVAVARRPRVGLISTGDEVVPPEAELQSGQVRDVNSFTLSALIESYGGEPVRYGIVLDREEELRNGVAAALAECEAVVVTAGSSASARDLTSQVIDRLGAPGVLVHGVNVRPGKPTILAVCDGKAVIGLPGNPVSALVIAGLFVVPVIEALLGLSRKRIRPQIQARLALNLPSQAGREDWVPVRLVPTQDGYLAEPVFGKSNLIFSLARADGLLRIPPDATGLADGQEVQVFLF